MAQMTPEIAVIDAHQYALIITIDLNGIAHGTSSKIDPAEAARLHDEATDA